MLQRVRVPFLRRQARGFGNCLEQPEELAAMKPAALLADEKKIRTIGLTIAQMRSQRCQLVE